jgi:hypothetical protein
MPVSKNHLCVSPKNIVHDHAETASTINLKCRPRWAEICNQIIDKRMSKSQQMRWDTKSAHELLQVRVRVIDGLLRDDFARWYPAFPANQSSMVIVA